MGKHVSRCQAHVLDEGRSVVWLFDTNKEFPIVNGVKAAGDPRSAGRQAAGPALPDL